MRKVVHGDAEMERFAAEYAVGLRPRGGKAVVVALSGELGAGKTTFVRGVLRFFGIEDAITSPTFVIEKIYTLPRGPFKTAVHVDAYRLKDAQELEALGWQELLKNNGALILVEWPERISGAVPPDAMRLAFEFGEGEERFVTVNKNASIKM